MNLLQFKNYSLLILFVLSIGGCIGVNQEFKDIRNQVFDDLSDDFEKDIEFSIGPLGFFLASKFVQLADDDENLDEMLSKISNIHLGIYKRNTIHSKPSLSLMRDLSNKFRNEEWNCIVRSLKENELVGIFIKADVSDEINELFVVTLNDEELVLIKLHGNLESIIDIFIREHGPNIRVTSNYENSN